MIQVFISYSGSKDRELADKLGEMLEASDVVDIEATIIPGESLPAEQNADIVTRKIDESHFFIPFYTADGRNSQWINQELGYAFGGLLRRDVQILPIYENRQHLKGLLNARSDNIHKDFRLNKKDPAETFRNVRKYLEREYESPMEMGFVIGRRILLQDGRWSIEAVLSISNGAHKTIREAFLSCIVPKDITFEVDKTMCQPFGLGGWQVKSTVIPKRFEDKVRKETEIMRYSNRLNDLLGPNVYDIEVTFLIPPDYSHFKFAMYLCAPLFGCIFYGGKIGRDESPEWNACNMKDEHIEIAPTIYLR